MDIHQKRSVLLVVDLQQDFLLHGALAVPGADEILAPIAELMEAELFELIVAAQDWHPPSHISFASSHPHRKPFDKIRLYGHEQILWPDHCVQGTPGADLYPGIPWTRAAAILRKGMNVQADSYSALRSNWDANGNRRPTGLAGYLKDREVEDIFICGLTRDFCIKWTAEDALQEGFRVNVIWDLSRSVDRHRDDSLSGELSAHGATIITLQELLNSRRQTILTPSQH
jgi:nicotinamidase/pyrazinamidase